MGFPSQLELHVQIAGHLAAVTVAFAPRRDFQWRRVAAYIAAQLLGATAACAMLRVVFCARLDFGAPRPEPGFTSF